MKFAVHELPAAERDVRSIFKWINARSPQGAAAWLDAYDQMIDRLASAPASFPLAIERPRLKLEVRQVLFKTKRGRIYRAVFHIDGEAVFILRVRGPGQRPMRSDDLEIGPVM